MIPARGTVIIEHIDTADDPRVSGYAYLTDREWLLAQGLFVAEGRLVVARLIGDGRFRIRSLLLSDAAYRSLAADLEARSPDTPVYICPARLFEGITGHHIHRGCLALVERPEASSVQAVCARARLIVVLEDVSDPDNVGGVFRSAAAFGVDAVLLSPSTCDPLYRKAIRTSMAAALTVPFARVHDWPGGLTAVHDLGFTIAALTPRAPAETLDRFAARPRPERLALLIGTEGAGLSEDALAQSDVRVRIPMREGVDSLNLSVAAGIALARLSELR